MKKESLSALADICIIAAVIAVGVKLLLGSVLSVLIPFASAYIVARAVYRPASFLSERSKIPIGIVSAVMVALLIALICGAVWLGLLKLMNEAAELLDRFADGGNGIAGAISSVLSKTESITSLIPSFSELGENKELSRICKGIDEFVHSSVNDFLKKISTDIGDFIASVIKSLPEIFLHIFVTVIASVYICSRMEGVNAFLIGLIPKAYRKRVLDFKARAYAALKAYFKGYSLIYLITFSELWLGFTLMHKRNGFILALLIATVDILPVFGVGIVLVPWALAELTAGNMGVFASLISLYAVITLVRQLAEPRIIGRSIGLDPLITLIAIFTGYKLFGVLGMILLPIAAVALIGGNKINSDEKCD